MKSFSDYHTMYSYAHLFNLPWKTLYLRKLLDRTSIHISNSTLSIEVSPTGQNCILMVKTETTEKAFNVQYTQ